MFDASLAFLINALADYTANSTTLVPTTMFDASLAFLINALADYTTNSTRRFGT